MQFKWDPFPVLETERLKLRRMNTGDLEQLFKIRSDEENMKYISRPLAKTMQDVVDLLGRTDEAFNNQDGINWAITSKEKDLMMGSIGFYRMKKEHFRAEVGYQIHKDFQMKGIMYEALKRVIDYGFQEMKLHTIEADINPDNIASIKLIEKGGFVKEGHFKDVFFFEGIFYDSFIYSRLNPDNSITY
ncbi:MAG: GNAT family N-acetyltransferase [Ginsengibacter sp.]